MVNIWIMYGYGWWEKPTPVKNMNFNWDDDIPKIGKNKKCSSHHQPEKRFHRKNAGSRSKPS